MRIILVMLFLFCFSTCNSFGKEQTRDIMSIINSGNKKQIENIYGIRGYFNDGRINIIDLYKAQLILKNVYGWNLETSFDDKITTKKNAAFLLPSNVLTSPKKGGALWILTGMHGEEPAGPSALAKHIKYFGELSKKNIPIVIFPLINPGGYYSNKRYPGQKNKRFDNETSIGDSEHLLLNKSGKSRKKAPASNFCDAFTRMVLNISNEYPPVVCLDLHEDNELDKCYIYSQGRMGRKDPVARNIIKALKNNHFPVLFSGRISEDEIISEGIISDVKDGSIDELLASEKIFRSGSVMPGPSALSVIVLETGSKTNLLSYRMKIQGLIIKMTESLWHCASRDSKV